MSKYNVELDLENENSLSILLKLIEPNSTILEFGSSHGRLTKYLKENLNCTVDIVELDDEAGKDVAQYARKALIGSELGNIENYKWRKKLEGNLYDYIIFADVLEHLYNPKKALAATKEFLKETGQVLISVPNVGHDGVLLELFNEQFNYRPTGLLDDTHIRFFTYATLLRLIDNAGFVAINEDAHYADVIQTEFSPHLQNNSTINCLLNQRTFGNIYQFIFVLRPKSDQLEVKKLDPSKKSHFSAMLYIKEKNDKDFTEEKSIKAYIEDDRFFADLSLFPDTIEVRLDPCEYSAAINILDHSSNLVYIKDNGVIRQHNRFVFNTTDPQIVYSLVDFSDTTISFTIELTPLTGNIVDQCIYPIYEKNRELIRLITEHENRVTDQYNQITDQHNQIEDQYNQIEDQHNQITDQHNQIEDQYNQIEDQHNQITDQHNQIADQHNQIEDQQNKILQQQTHINSLYSSRSWKITKPLRKISHLFHEIYPHKAHQNPVQKQCIFDHDQINVFKLSSLESIGHKKRILFVVHSANQGGATFLSLDMITRLRKGHDYFVVTIVIVNGSNLEEIIQNSDVLYCLNQKTFESVDNEEDIITIVDNLSNNYSFDKCIINSVTGGILCEILHKNNFKITTLVHEMYDSICRHGYKESSKGAGLYTNHIVFPAKSVQKSFQDNFKVITNSIHIKPQGLYAKQNTITSKSSIAHKMICNKLNIPNDSYIVLNIGYGDHRKGFDLFIETAIKARKLYPKINFIWVGNYDPLILTPNLKDFRNYIRHIDYTSELQEYYAGADVFFLSSREDPFPSVALDALYNQTPIICFKDSGGIESVCNYLELPTVESHCTSKALEIIVGFLTSNSKNTDNTNKYRDYVLNYHDQDQYVAYILNLFNSTNQVAHKDRPKVSVIIPNYNYERYLEERLNSIINQTTLPAEIIFLDDNSQDNSVNIAENLLKKSNIPYRIEINKKNIGCFAQWQKGIELAQHEIIWIAEADDVAEPSFIECLSVEFIDSNVNLAYCQSMIIDEFSLIHSDDYLDFTDEFSNIKWIKNYRQDGKLEIIENLCIKNTIPNASAVLIRKSALDGSELDKFKICGDWYTYIYALQEGQISFISESLNKHRRHSQSIINRLEKSSTYFEEIIEIKKQLIQLFTLPKNIRDTFLEVIPLEYERLGCQNHSNNIRENIEINDKYSNLIALFDKETSSYLFQKVQKNILFVMPDLEIGGGQILIIRLANFLARYQSVSIYVARPYLANGHLIDMISNKINLFLGEASPSKLSKFIKDNKIDIINSHIWWADKITYQALDYSKDLTTRWVMSIHGCYEALLENPDWDPDFDRIVGDIFLRADHVIYATNKNTPIFNYTHYPQNKTSKIYYGYEKQGLPPINKEKYHIDDNAFIFGMVARGIEEKGWQEAIEAFINIIHTSSIGMYLVLVGSGSYIDLLKEQYSSQDKIIFVQDASHNSEWIKWIQIFNVGLLPTYFISESLPNTIIEYLAYSKPVISTDIGDIKYMIIDNANGLCAGHIIPLRDKKVLVEDLQDIMYKMVNTDLSSFSQDALKIFNSKFEINNFVNLYFSVFIAQNK